jgi:hypothetical protein
MKIITTKTELRNWVDSATTNWDGRSDEMLSDLVDALQASDHPAWGTDWSEWLDALPDLTELLD